MAPEQILVQHKKVLQQTMKELNEFQFCLSNYETNLLNHQKA
jgi:hypothetical protein